MKAWTLVIIILVFVLLVAALIIVSMGWSLDKKDYKYKFLQVQSKFNTIQARVNKRNEILADIKLANTFRDYKKTNYLIGVWEDVRKFEKEQDTILTK